MEIKCILQNKPAVVEIMDGYGGDVMIKVGGPTGDSVYMTPTTAIQFGLDLIAFANRQLLAVPKPAEEIPAVKTDTVAVG